MMTTPPTPDHARAAAADWRRRAEQLSGQEREDALRTAAGWEAWLPAEAPEFVAPLGEPHAFAPHAAGDPNAFAPPAPGDPKAFAPPAPGQPAFAPAALAAPRQRWPRDVRRWLIGTIAIAATVSIAAPSATALAWQRALTPPGETAEVVVDDFLTAAIAGDTETVVALSAGDRFAHLTDRGLTPLLGDPATAKQLSLRITTEVLEMSYQTSVTDTEGTPLTAESSLMGADRAQALIEFTYALSAGDTEIESVAVAPLSLTRAMFYGGSDEPENSRYAETPTAMGPWLVSGFDWDVQAFPGVETPDIESTLEVTADRCYYPLNVIADIAETTRREGYIPGECFLDGPDFGGIGPGVDVEEVVNSFPVFNREQTLPDAIGMISEGGSAPLAQIIVPAGERDYLITLAPNADERTLWFVVALTQIDPVAAD